MFLSPEPEANRLGIFRIFKQITEFLFVFIDFTQDPLESSQIFINESNEVSEEYLMLWSEKFLRIVFKMSVGKTWLNCRDRNRSTTILTKLSDVWSLKINSQQLHDFVLNYFDVNKLNNINCMVFH